MGARPSSFKKGGGFLNNVDGVIAGYTFTDEFNGVAFVPSKDPKTKKEKFHSLYTVLSFRTDGADEDVTTTLFTGGADDFEISEDGHTLTPVEDGRELGANTSWAKLITSLVEAGFPETLLPEDTINYESIIGTRVRLTQKTNAEDTKKLGKRKGKDGREFDRQDLMVSELYDLPSATPAKAGKPAKAAKAGKAAPAVGEDIADLSGRALSEILIANSGTIAKAKLSMKTLTTPLLKGHAQRDEVRSWLFDDANLAELMEAGVIEFVKKTGLITAV